MTDDDYDALSQKQLASIKRDMRISLNDAAVRATHKVVAELIEEAVKAERASMTKDEALKLALEALDAYDYGAVRIIIHEALAQPDERNFCPRCGKRTADLTTVHTCTPPLPAQRQWVGLTDEELIAIVESDDCDCDLDIAILVQVKLKELNT